jgi:HSP20 family molecular chaperone IbpA
LRYRRLAYHYTLIGRGTWPLTPSPWSGDVLNLLLGRAHWRPDADVRETARSVEIFVDLAGVEDDDVEVQLFENALVVEGDRQLPAGDPETFYHTAGIRRGPFRLELPLPAPVDAGDVEARFERGLLHITIRKQGDRR